MLLPTNSSPLGFQTDFYHNVTEKTKFFASKCVNSKSPTREKNGDTLRRNRFRFCVCTGPRKNNKKSAKWYVKSY
ncbi:unnamed protein product [Acanthoscelides obtectus]|uniref:Uncharacterized protein n=1 Tax=Acanthoscelides obtectus TaxID=200917 RepID=A0A9P0M307_ACAOB|nr:unnamed protein product [Acanthoscelides obtectus]CAK1678085.1 hypothetical protein AOBTE_LOCUS31748 [Acanthoscelides obtectus]